jgi:trehalose synthase
MSEIDAPAPQARPIPRIQDYEPLVGAEIVDRVLAKANRLQDRHIANVSSTYYGGGVAELLSSQTLLFNSMGIRTGWRIIQGAPDFFSVTKKMHNALQGSSLNLTERKKQIYQDVLLQNVARNHLDRHDMVVVHDPQPLGMIGHYRRHGPWIWRCHIDLTAPNPELWAYLRPFIERYDAVVVSLPEYRQDLETPQVVIMPAIDPFTTKNAPMSDRDMDERLEYYGIPDDLPLVVQISRFDRWKDPEGVIQAFKIARKQVDATLVLLGNVATDDPEGETVYQSLLDKQEDRIIILSKEDTALVNALQSRAAVVLQKSLREGFGLTVTEAMWKGTPVIGGDVGGIRHQITDGECGYLVSSIDEAAARIVELLKKPELRRTMGERARRRVQERFLMIRMIEEHLDLCSSFVTSFRLVR